MMSRVSSIQHGQPDDDLPRVRMQDVDGSHAAQDAVAEAIR